MANAYHVNQYYQSTPDFFYQILLKLQAHSWTRPKDSDGTTYSSSGAAITNASLATAGSLWNPLAWYQLRHPMGLCEYIVQKGSTNAATTGDYWKVFLSYLGFSGGAPNATTPPTATDQVQICGAGGADAVFGETDMDYRTDLIIGDANENYSFYAQQRPLVYGGTSETQRGNTVKTLWGFEQVLDPDPADPSPYVSIIGITLGTGTTYDMFSDTSDIFRPDVGSVGALGSVKGAIGRYRHGSEGGQWVKYALTAGAQRLGTDAQLLFASGGTTSPFTARATAIPMFWMRGTGGVTAALGVQTWAGMQYKGRSRFLKYFSTMPVPGGFTLPQKRYAQFTSVIIPWDGVSVVR